jgi:tRNA-specific 2-thiouridylase
LTTSSPSTRPVRTPNPCLRCNENIKFAAVLDRAVALGFDAVVTGHHARLARTAAAALGRPGKDQSYVLAVLTRAQLDRSVFPLGDSTKAEVRAEAAGAGLAVAEKPDSHDICFIADGDTRGSWRPAGRGPGAIVGRESGEVVGQHAARSRSRSASARAAPDRPAADGRPRYVLSITPVTNTVTVGPPSALEVSTVVGDRPVWTAGRHRTCRSSARFSCGPTVSRCRPW